MTFTPLHFVIAALVVAVIVGLAVLARRKRGAKGPAPEALPVAEEDAPTRRRQLQSFVDTEWDTAPEPLPEAAPSTAQIPPVETFAPAPADPEPLAAETFVEAPPAPIEDDLPDYDQAVMGRLEQAFEALQAGEITLDAYRERILSEEAAVDRRIALLEVAGDSAELQAALVAQESVRWCLDWANDQSDAAPE